MIKIAATRNYKAASAASAGEIIVFNLKESLANIDALSPEVKSQLSDIRDSIQFALSAANTLVDFSAGGIQR